MHMCLNTERMILFEFHDLQRAQRAQHASHGQVTLYMLVWQWARQFAQLESKAIAMCSRHNAVEAIFPANVTVTL